jgi:hypothetical protein
MAYWTPPFKDGKHAPMPGTAGFCYADNQLCGGEDIAGIAIVCLCCQRAAASAPEPAGPSPAPGTPDGPAPQPFTAQPIITDQPQTPGEQSVQQAGQEGAKDETPADAQWGAAEFDQAGFRDPAWPDRPPEVPVS